MPASNGLRTKTRHSPAVKQKSPVAIDTLPWIEPKPGEDEALESPAAIGAREQGSAAFAMYGRANWNSHVPITRQGWETTVTIFRTDRKIVLPDLTSAQAGTVPVRRAVVWLKGNRLPHRARSGSGEIFMPGSYPAGYYDSSLVNRFFRT
jgi:hypothetical protein